MLPCRKSWCWEFGHIAVFDYKRANSVLGFIIVGGLAFVLTVLACVYSRTMTSKEEDPKAVYGDFLIWSKQSHMLLMRNRSVNIIGQKIFKLAVWRQQFQSALAQRWVNNRVLHCLMYNNGQYIYIYTYVHKWWQNVHSSQFDYLLQKRGKQLQNWIPKMVKIWVPLQFICPSCSSSMRQSIKVGRPLWTSR